MPSGLLDSASHELLTTSTMGREMSQVIAHQPVMVEEVRRSLNPTVGGIIVDGTIGSGGHSLALLPQLLPNGRLIAIDRDLDALQRARQRLTEFSPTVEFIHDNYRHLPEILRRCHAPQVNGVLLDLGMSSVQVDSAERGFSFSKEGPLDMRMDPTQALTAERLINTRGAEELTMILEQLGEERFARRIANRIVQARREQPIQTTTQLAQLVVDAVPPAARHGRVHVATRTFQALRMAVNDELGGLQELLAHLQDVLMPGGRAVVLSFHSLEDRIVKHQFSQGMREGFWRILTKKPVIASEEEVARNPRARSAKLRAIERYA